MWFLTCEPRKGLARELLQPCILCRERDHDGGGSNGGVLQQVRHRGVPRHARDLRRGRCFFLRSLGRCNFFGGVALLLGCWDDLKCLRRVLGCQGVQVVRFLGNDVG